MRQVGAPSSESVRRPAWREAVEATRQGLPVGAVDELVQARRLSAGELDRIVLSRKTLSHRRRIGTLTPDQSDRVLRVRRLIEHAEAAFGSPDKASRWLRRPTTALGGEAPLDLLDTSEGSRAVETLLGRIEHGVAA